MKISTMTMAVAANLLSLTSAGQIDFYSDRNCQNYIGTSFPGVGYVVGGPAGAFSARWIDADQKQCSRTCGPLVLCGDASCSRRRASPLRTCVSFDTGIWGKNACGFDMCGNA